MNISVPKSSIFIAFVWLLLSSISGVRSMADNKCDFPSGAWKGPCLHDAQCDPVCRNREGALRGFCPTFQCWCEHSCENLCARPSGLWKGICVGHIYCGKMCREQENAFAGRCTDMKCMCSYKCNN